MVFDPNAVAHVLRKSLATSLQWTKANHTAGQCNVTSLLVHELFFSQLLKTRLPEATTSTTRLMVVGSNLLLESTSLADVTPYDLLFPA